MLISKEFNSSTFFSQLENQDLQTKKCLVLVSGGPDSVFLFHLFLNLQKQFGVNFDVLHFNHHLRGAESDAEQKFVQTLCEQNQIECLVQDLHFPKTSSLQEKARKARFETCCRLQNTYDYHYFFLAHHQDDLLETLVMRQERGAGVSGLKGIRRLSLLKNSVFPKKKLTFFRPLLNLSKAQIVNALDLSGLAYCLDSSNQQPKYFRNRVRKELAQISLSLEKRELISKQVVKLQLCDEYFQKRVVGLVKTYSRFVPLEAWKFWPAEIQFRFFQFKMREKGFKQQVEDKHFRATQKKIAKLVLGAACFFKDESGCYFLSQNELETLQNYCYCLSGPGSYYLGAFDLQLSLRYSDDFKPLGFANRFFLSADQLSFPFEVSLTRMTDRFLPFGKGSILKLKDFLSEKKIPLYARKFLPVLKTAGQEIVLVFGVELAKNYQVLPMTRKVLEVRIL